MGYRSPMRMGKFEGKSMPRHARWHSGPELCKNAGPIEMPFALWTRVGSRKYVLDGSRSPCEEAIIRGKDMPGHERHSAVSCAKMAETIDLPYGLWTRVGRRKVTLVPPGEYDWSYLPGGTNVTSWEGTLAPPGGRDAALCQINLTNCLFNCYLSFGISDFIFWTFFDFNCCSYIPHAQLVILCISVTLL